MIYLFLMISFVYLILLYDSDSDKESLAMAWVGPDEFNKNKNIMSEQEFKKYVQDNAEKMCKVMEK